VRGRNSGKRDSVEAKTADYSCVAGRVTEYVEALIKVASDYKAVGICVEMPIYISNGI
jgi:predicted NBD/HSP70 family sugar kinase